MIGGWLTLFVSSALNLAWLVSLRYAQGFQRLLPLAGVALFGMTSTYCLSRAMLVLPTSIAYAVFMGLTVVGSVAIDAFILREPLGAPRIGFVVLIVLGTAGLQATTTALTVKPPVAHASVTGDRVVTQP
jgi:quaternary ammonium compound-resistance protein SugE